MTVKKKRIMQVSALLVGSFVLAQTVLSEIPESTFAQQSFNGIESLIQSHNESDPYTIVELVPDASYAKLGYLVGGSEPFYYDEAAKSYQTYEEHLAALTNSADREEFSEEMKSTLSSITSASNPLTYEEYEESYVSQAGYTKLELAYPETIAAGTSEYYMQKVDGNTGDYQRQSKSGVYADKEQSSDSDGVQDKEQVQESDSAAGEDDGNDVEEQTVEQQTVEQDEEPGAEPTAAIVEDTDEEPGVQPNEDPVEDPDEASGVQPNEDPAEDPDEASGTQPAPAADEDRIYYYEYVGEGNGDYRLIKSEDGSRKLDADVVVSEIYYQGGFTNNEWFKEYVFNQSGLLNASDTDISISVVALTPAQFAKYNGDMDLLYISGSSLLDTSNAQYYGAGNDLSASLADEIYAKVDSENTYLPVILDYAILQNSSIENTNIYKLAKRLIPQDLTMDNYAHGYVKDNVYLIPCKDAGSSASFLNAFGSIFLDCSNVSGDEFAAKAAAIGFGDVADTIISENTYRQVENNAGTGNTYDYFDQKLSEAIAVEYIISYASKREEYDLDTIQVLDIEPCTVSSSTQETIEKNIRQYLQLAGVTDTEKVVFTHMTSAEFISKVEDLCKYDMIYMGLYTDTLNTDKTTGRTVYNDSDMNGLVYTNIGDIQYYSKALGLLDTEYKTAGSHYSITNPSGSKLIADYSSGNYVRYSGNDFTDEKVKAIKNFVLSGAPVILDKDFLTEAGGTTYVYDFARNEDGSKNTSEQGYIDNCSKVYELIEYIKDYPNVIRENEVSADSNTQQNLLQYLTLGKPVLSVTTAAKESGQEYVKINGSVVSFDFSIENYGSADANATFDCVLYADYNSDGRYSNTTERIGANDFSITLNGVKQTVKSKTDEDGTIYYYELSPNTGGESYHLEYTVSSSYVGIIPVKIKVSQSGNDYRYASDEFYFFKPRNTKEKLKIHVLQILPTSGNNVFNMGEKGVYDGNLTSSTSAFYHYLHALEDYDISIDAMKASRYVEKYNENPNFLDDYDMLVLGFADDYNFLEQYGSLNEAATISAYEGIKAFIDSGKSVLFTHDTTSYTSNPNIDYSDWGFTLSQLLTEDVGLDRYGVNDSLLLKAGIKGLTQGGTTTYNVSDYQSLSLAYKSGILKKTSYTAGELFELIVKEAKEKNKDIAYKPNSDKTVLTSEVQGRSSITINTQIDTKVGLTLKNVNTSVPTTSFYTNSAELINEGGILIYPYNVLAKIKSNNNILNVVNTHGQYFQIDMNEDADADGESDVTVWMSLAGDSYGAVQKDARNNYYIYTKGNVTYSGVGHFSMDYYYTGAENAAATEIQLYINTMVTAYRAGTHAPTMTLTDEDGSELNVIYVGVDSKLNDSGQVAEETQIDQGTEKVYVTVRDTNDVSAEYKRISVAYYLAYGSSIADLPDGVNISDVVNIGTEADPIYAKKCDWTTYRTDGSTQDSTNLTSGVKYYVNVPYDLVNKMKNGRAQVYVVATTRLWNEGEVVSASEPSVTYKTTGSFYLQRIGLFDLE
jgi:hypothetical protein